MMRRAVSAVNSRSRRAEVDNVRSTLEELTFHVPELKQRPIVGAGCCALPAEFLIEEALNEVERVHRVVVSEEEGLVRVWVTEADQGLIEELKDRIGGARTLGAGPGYCTALVSPTSAGLSRELPTQFFFVRAGRL